MRSAVVLGGGVVLFALVTAFALTRDHDVLAADPLTTIFGAGRGGARRPTGGR